MLSFVIVSDTSQFGNFFGMFPSSAGGEKQYVYFMAIIDVLTHYGVKKQAAKAAKTVKYGEKAEGISTVEPEQYGKRFMDFMSKAID